MGLFTRRARPVDANTATAAGTTTTREKTPRAGGGFMGMLRGRHNGTYPETRNSRPTFGQWLKQTWIDIITMIILGAIGLGVSPASLQKHLDRLITHEIGLQSTTSPNTLLPRNL
jgi:diacylglycerol diphosphate phosphatase/phosphatidate phosphatase